MESLTVVSEMRPSFRAVASSWMAAVISERDSPAWSMVRAFSLKFARTSPKEILNREKKVHELVHLTIDLFNRFLEFADT